MLEVISRLHPTAGQQCIGGADNGGVPKSGPDVELIILERRNHRIQTAIFSQADDGAAIMQQFPECLPQKK